MCIWLYNPPVCCLFCVCVRAAFLFSLSLSAGSIDEVMPKLSPHTPDSNHTTDQHPPFCCCFCGAAIYPVPAGSFCSEYSSVCLTIHQPSCFLKTCTLSLSVLGTTTRSLCHSHFAWKTHTLQIIPPTPAKLVKPASHLPNPNVSLLLLPAPPY